MNANQKCKPTGALLRTMIIGSGLSSALALLALLPSASHAQAVPGFDFTFKPIPGAVQGNLPNAICNIPGQADYGCVSTYGFSRDTKTSFIQETVNLGGQDYYHVVVGQPDQNFAQEVLIKTSTVVFYGNTLSDSGGGRCLGGGPFDSPACATDNNGRSPLGDFSVSGNGSGNPQSVLIRQVLADPAGGFSQEFLKANFAKKPVITANLNSAGVVQAFVMDMSNSDYKTAASGKMTNTTNVEGVGTWDADKGFGGGPNPGKLITAGKYTYQAVDPATGFPKLGNPKGSEAWTYGTYLYYDDPSDPTKVTEFDFGTANWGTPIDPKQNLP